MAIFWDYIKGVERDWTDSSGNFHEGGTCLTKIVFKKDEKPEIWVNNINYGSIITKEGSAQQEINTDLKILNGHTIYGQLKSSNVNITNTLNINNNAQLFLQGNITVNNNANLEIVQESNNPVIFSKMIVENLDIQHQDKNEVGPRSIFEISPNNILFNKPLRISELEFTTMP